MRTLTIIVPAYNVEKCLTECLDSLVHQTYIDHKIVIVNDGSTDHTHDIATQYAASYPDIITYISQENKGLGGARNVGLEHVDTPWVTFLDSDDFLHIRYVEVFRQWLSEADVLPEIIFTLPWQLDVNSRCIYPWMDKPLYDEIFRIYDGGISTNAQHDPRLYALEVSACRKIYSTAFLRGQEFRFPEGLKWEDVPGHFELLHKAHSVCAIPQIGFIYRTNQSTQTTSSGGADRLDMIVIFRMLLEVADRHDFSQVEMGYVIRLMVIFSKWSIAVTNTMYLEKLLAGLHDIYATLRTDDVRYYIEHISDNRSYDDGFVKCLMSSRYMQLYDYRTRDEAISASSYYLFDNPDRKRSIIAGGVQCVKDHGFVYTAKLSIKKVLRKLSR